MLYIIIFLIGLILGSFVNVVIYRLPRGRTFITGRSQCPGCGKEISWYDLVPIFSFLWLRACCRRCKAKIPWSYPAIEIYSGVVFAVSFWLLGNTGLANWLFGFFLLESFLVLAVVDLEHFILPDPMIIFVFSVAVVYGVSQRFFGVSGRTNILSVENLVSAVLAFSFFFLIWLGSKGEWMGLGDAKLAGLIGLVFGALGSAVIFYIAIVLGALFGLVLLGFKKAKLKTQLPLGSFMSGVASAYILFGPFMVERTKDIFRFVIPLFKFYN